jgi:outer membrane protein W
MKERMWQWQRILTPLGLAAFLIFPVACATTATGANGTGVNTGTTNSNGTSVSGTDISGAAAPATGSSSGSASTTGGGSTYAGTGTSSTGSGSTYGTTGTSSTGSGTGTTSTGSASTYGSGSTSAGMGTSSTGSGSTYGNTGTSSTGTGTGSTYAGTSSTGSGSTYSSTGTSSTNGTSFAGDTTTGSTSGTTSGTTTGSTDTYGTTGSMTSSTTQDNTSGSWRPSGFYGSRGTAGSGGHMWGLTVSGVRGQFDNGNSSGNIGGNAGTLNSDFGNTTGFGVGVTGFLGRMLAVDLGASYLRPRVNYTPSTAGIGTIGGGRLRMIPLTALLQLHFLPGSFIDPYVGGGGAYMLMRNKTNLDANATGVRSVSYDNRFGGAVQGGVMLGFGAFGLNLDAKYLPLKVRSDAQFATGGGTTLVSTRGDAKINPWLFSVGLSFGF